MWPPDHWWLCMKLKISKAVLLIKSRLENGVHWSFLKSFGWDKKIRWKIEFPGLKYLEGYIPNLYYLSGVKDPNWEFIITWSRTIETLQVPGYTNVKLLSRNSFIIQGTRDSRDLILPRKRSLQTNPVNQTTRHQSQETSQRGILICKQECKIVKLHLRAMWQ